MRRSRPACRHGSQQTMRTNTYDPATGVITVDEDRAQAIRQVNDHYMRPVRLRPGAEHAA